MTVFWNFLKTQFFPPYFQKVFPLYRTHIYPVNLIKIFRLIKNFNLEKTVFITEFYLVYLWALLAVIILCILFFFNFYVAIKHFRRKRKFNTCCFLHKKKEKKHLFGEF